MTHLVTGYAGYAHISSADDGAFNAAFFGDGQYVMEFGNQFEGSIIDNNTVRILDGEGLMYGRHFRIDPNTHEDLTITTGTAGTNRIDLICMTYEKNASDETEKCYLQVIKGTSSSGTAVAPKPTDGNILNGASFNQMPLYKVTIEGVVLKKIETLFETLPTYKALGEYYAGVFQQRCDEVLENLPIDALTPEDVVDNLLSTSATLPLSAKQGNKLKTDLASLSDEVDELQQSFSSAADAIGDALVAKGVSVPTGTSLAEMATLISENMVSSKTVVKQSGSFTDSSLINTTKSKLITFSKPFGQIPTVTVATSSSNIVCTAEEITQTSFKFKYVVPNYGIQNDVTFNWSAQANSFA